MVDYNHAKVIAEQGAVVSISGTRDGIPVGPRDRLGNTFDIMEFTDGLNQIFAGAMYRWQHERWTPHVGFGVGASVPHVEVRRTGSTVRTFDYQVAGVAVEGLVGLEYRLGPRLSAFGDYKLSFSSNDADLKGGGRSKRTSGPTILSWVFRTRLAARRNLSSRLRCPFS